MQSQPGGVPYGRAAMKGLGIKDYVLKDGSGNIILRAGRFLRKGELFQSPTGQDTEARQRFWEAGQAPRWRRASTAWAQLTGL